MEPTTTVPIWRTLVNWGAVVILGSLICPIIVGDINPGIILIFLFFSTLCSLPALVIFILVNLAFNGKLSARKYTLRQGLIHFGVSVLTFVVVAFSMDFEEADFILPIAVVYTGLGQLAWWLTFSTVKPTSNNH